MDSHLFQQAPHMYAYTAYIPPAYHGHTGYTQSYTAPVGWGGAYYPNGTPPSFGDPSTTTPPTQALPASSSASATPADDVISQPHDNDVLMGRGGKNNQHSGNERLRDMARAVRDQYKASSKKGKSNMSRDLVQAIRDLVPPGRFLKRNPVTSEWEDVGDEIAREKVSQVLRDAVSEWVGPKAAAKGDKARNGAPESGGPEDDQVQPNDESKPKSTADVKSANSSRTSSPVRVKSPVPAPLISVPTRVSRVVTDGETIINEQPAPAEEEEDGDESRIELEKSPFPPPARSRADTDQSDISFGSGLDDDISFPDEDTLAEETSDSYGAAPSESPQGGTTRRGFRRVPVSNGHIASFRNKRKPNLLDRYSNTCLGISDMSIGSQLSCRNLETQLSGRQLMNTGAKEMNSRQLSTRTLSSRQLSNRGLATRQSSGRTLSSRKFSNRGLMGAQQRKQYLDMMGESDLSLDSLMISEHSTQLSRKNVFMEQYMNMDMGLSDFSLGSLPEGDAAYPRGGGLMRPSVIVEGDLEELSEHSSSTLKMEPGALLNMYAATGVGISTSNMTVNTIGTFSGHSRMSRGIYGTGNSMRLESGHSFLLANAVQLDMLDDELFDEYSVMDDLDEDDEFSSDFI